MNPLIKAKSVKAVTFNNPSKKRTRRISNLLKLSENRKQFNQLLKVLPPPALRSCLEKQETCPQSFRIFLLSQKIRNNRIGLLVRDSSTKMRTFNKAHVKVLINHRNKFSQRLWIWKWTTIEILEDHPIFTPKARLTK